MGRGVNTWLSVGVHEERFSELPGPRRVCRGDGQGAEFCNSEHRITAVTEPQSHGNSGKRVLRRTSEPEGVPRNSW